MTVRAADLTLRDFSNYPLPRRSYANQGADVRLFRASYVIELKNSHIGFTAVNAMMRAKILCTPRDSARGSARCLLCAVDCGAPCFGDNEPCNIRSDMLGSGKRGHRDVWQNSGTEATDDKPHISSY